MSSVSSENYDVEKSIQDKIALRQKEENEYDKLMARADEKLRKANMKPNFDDIVSNMTEHEATAFHFMPDNNDNFEELVQVRKTPTYHYPLSESRVMITDKLLSHIVWFSDPLKLKIRLNII